jgi:hypothetical protein
MRLSAIGSKARSIAMVTADPLPLIRKLLEAGANPNALVNNTPRARMREGSPRIVFATALMCAAFAAAHWRPRSEVGRRGPAIPHRHIGYSTLTSCD